MFEPIPLSDAAKVVVALFAEQFPIPATDEASREWTHRLCQQLAFSVPSEPWGHKSAGGTRPHSTDVVAHLTPILQGWDVIVDGGTPHRRLDLDALSMDLTGQDPEPVIAHNWLGIDPPPPPPPPVDSCPYTAKLDIIIVQLDRIHAAIDELEAAVGAATEALRQEVAKGIRVRLT